jgi:regulatory protein
VPGKSPGRSRSPRSPGSQNARIRGDNAGRAAAPGRGGLGKSDGDNPGDAAEQQSDPESVARLICLRQLTAAPRTRAQLAATLRRRGVPEDAAHVVLGRFAEVGLINDAMFADAWVESRHHGRGLGRRALAAELNQRGVERGDIQAAVAKLTPETELATARALVERRLDSTAEQPVQVRVRRLAGMLARKGYPAGLAYRVVREALDQAGQDHPDEGLDEDELISAELAGSEPD